ncbi:MAG: nucleoside deaminase, partial [Muribaculaceae bacterium]|nr:nucleoside deaminase [Muribaculaceae bacterium]
CLMCAVAICWSSIGRVVYCAPDPKRGYSTIVAKSPFHPKTKVEGGVLADECGALMKEFFIGKR